MRVLVCGDRKWRDGDAIYNRLCSLKGEHGPFTVVHGGADGADAFAHWAAHCLLLPVDEHRAEWDKHGRAAGPIRNRKMLDTKPDLVLAFHGNLEKSRGTRDCVTEARRRGIPTEVIAQTLRGDEP